MSNALNPVNIDVPKSQFLAANASYLIGKQDRTLRVVDDIYKYVSKWWGDWVDDFNIPVQARIAKGWTSILEFGAIGDGVADDSPAFQAAIDYLDSVGGGELRLPRGTYKLLNGITVGGTTAHGAIAIKGSSIWGTKILTNLEDTTVFRALELEDPMPLGEADRLHFITISDLWMDNTSAANTGAVAIDLSNCTRCNVTKVRMINFESGVRMIGRAYYNEFEKVYIRNGATGFYFALSANSNILLGCQIDSVDSGIEITDGAPGFYTNEIRMFSPMIEGVTDFGIHFNATHDQGVDRCSVYGGRVEGYDTAIGIMIPAFARSIFVQHTYLSALSQDFVNESITSRVELFGIHNLAVMDMDNHVSAAYIRWVQSEAAFYLTQNNDLSLLANLFIKELTAKGRYVRGDRFCSNRGSNIFPEDIEISAGWGDAAIVTTTGKDTGGSIKIKALGAGIAAQPDWTLVWKDGPWADGVPRVQVIHNGGWADGTPPRYFKSANDLLVILVQTPNSGEEFTFEWMTMG